MKARIDWARGIMAAICLLCAASSYRDGFIEGHFPLGRAGFAEGFWAEIYGGIATLLFLGLFVNHARRIRG